jgi:hypothetical protein
MMHYGLKPPWQKRRSGCYKRLPKGGTHLPARVGNRLGLQVIAGCALGLLHRARLASTVTPSGVPAAEHVACGFPAPRASACRAAFRSDCQ